MSAAEREEELLNRSRILALLPRSADVWYVGQAFLALDRLAEAERKLGEAESRLSYGLAERNQEKARADRLARALERIRDFKPDDARALSPAFQHSVFSSEIARAALSEPKEPSHG